MTSTETTTPTDREREIGNEIGSDYYGSGSEMAASLGADVAQALADQRAKYEALAGHLERLAGTCASVAEDSRDAGMAEAATYAADRIRKVAQQ